MDLQTLILIPAFAFFTALSALILLPLILKFQLVTPHAVPKPNQQNKRPKQGAASANPDKIYSASAARIETISTTGELALLRKIVDFSPTLIWIQNPEGRITWANNPYLDVAGKVEPAPDDGVPGVAAIFSATPDDENSGHGRRLSVAIKGQNTPWWFEVSSFDAGASGRLCFAGHANSVVRAEEALRNFVQTLTKTFAHLPIGLAIFDRRRQLALFNPALADLTTLGPEWLSRRPSLFSFLDKLRENRQMPEPKNYPDWRRKMIALEQGAVDGTYCEDWSLPSGQTYRVTGRPHPEGAVAFLFEDISASISLQRRFRTELELCQSVIDNFRDAIAVFESGSEVTMSNSAFARCWNLDPANALGRLDVIDVTKHCQSMCAPSPIWGDLREFVGQLRDRAEWDASLKLLSGGTVDLRVSPLSGGATLCVFSFGTDEGQLPSDGDLESPSVAQIA